MARRYPTFGQPVGGGIQTGFASGFSIPEGPPRMTLEQARTGGGGLDGVKKMGRDALGWLGKDGHGVDLLSALVTGYGIYNQGQEQDYARELSDEQRAMLAEDRAGAKAEYASRAPLRGQFNDWATEDRPPVTDASNPFASKGLPPKMTLAQLNAQMRRG